MPLYTADAGSIGPRVLAQVPEKFLIFYSSPVDGKLWCPDCRDVETLVKETFDRPDAPSALIIHVGDVSQWRAPTNPFRGEPWHLTHLPTIVKLEGGKESGRLVETEIQKELASFVEE